jgi:hypothetical protein
MADVRHAWVWYCADCHGMLAWIRDSFQGRRFLAVLTHEAEATAEELMARGVLAFVHDSPRQAPLLACACTGCAGTEPWKTRQ